MPTYSIRTKDGTRIAYDIDGDGPPILLLHGGSMSRATWREVGYVDRLKGYFRVITMDIRGHGESDRPLEIDAHNIDTLCQDILAVADACQADQFVLWGYSYGANIARYLAATSPRVQKLVMLGAMFGPGAAGEFRKEVELGNEYWRPAVEANRRGTLDLARMPLEMREAWESMDVPATMPRMQAILDWRAVEPEDILCPTLWICGSNSTRVVANMQEYKSRLGDTAVETLVIDGLDHAEEFTSIETVFPPVFEFVESG